MKTGKILCTIDVSVVESWKEVLMSGITICVGGGERVSEAVTRQLAGRNAACVVIPNLAANVHLMSGECGLT